MALRCGCWAEIRDSVGSVGPRVSCWGPHLDPAALPTLPPTSPAHPITSLVTCVAQKMQWRDGSRWPLSVASLLADVPDSSWRQRHSPRFHHAWIELASAATSPARSRQTVSLNLPAFPPSTDRVSLSLRMAVKAALCRVSLGEMPLRNSDRH